MTADYHQLDILFLDNFHDLYARGAQL